LALSCGINETTLVENYVEICQRLKVEIDKSTRLFWRIRKYELPDLELKEKRCCSDIVNSFLRDTETIIELCCLKQTVIFSLHNVLEITIFYVKL
jgi:hypothetical protein